MLVPSDINTPPAGISHTGDKAVAEHNRNNPNNILFFPSPY